MEKVKIQTFFKFFHPILTHPKRLLNNFQKIIPTLFHPQTPTHYVRGQDKHIFSEIKHFAYFEIIFRYFITICVLSKI